MISYICMYALHKFFYALSSIYIYTYIYAHIPCFSFPNIYRSPPLLFKSIMFYLIMSFEFFVLPFICPEGFQGVCGHVCIGICLHRSVFGERGAI